MYLSFYGLEREPFHITPDPDFLYLSPSHKEAFATIVYGVEQRKGFVALTGEVGTGKTTVLRAYLKRVDSSKIRAIYLFNPSLTFLDLLRILLRELGVEHPEEKHEPTMLEQLQWALLKEYEARRNVALIVDEAQNMPVETLERMRMLSNLETTQDKLLQIVLVGQPELDDLLAQHALRQLTQRIAVKAHIRALSPEESEAYIAHRLMQAGCIREQIFSNGALKAIVRHCQGTPRALNIACDNALIAGFGGQEEVVSLPTAREVLRDLKGVSRPRAKSKWAMAAGVAGAAAILLALALVSGGGMSASNLEELTSAPQATTETAERTTPSAAAASARQDAVVTSSDDEAVAEVQAATAAANWGGGSSEAAKGVERDDETVSGAEKEKVHLATRTTNAMDTREIALKRIAEQSRALEEGIPPPPTAAPDEAPASEETAESVKAENGRVATPASETHALATLPATVVAESENRAASERENTIAPKNSTDPVTSRTADSSVSSKVEADGPDPFVGANELRKTVVEGDQLLRILVQVYGFHSPQLIAAVLERNPQIDDMDYIRAGDQLVLPAPEVLNLAEGQKQSNSDRNPS